MQNKKTYLTLAVLAIIAVIAVFLLTNSAEAPAEADTPTTLVTLTNAGSALNQSDITLIGQVRAFSESAITAEQSGRVTSVQVALGQSVVAGQVVTTLESASQQAAVTQAEGVYEAALAAAAQNEVGTDEAQTQLTSAQSNVVTNYKSAFGQVNSTILTAVDPFFSDPNSTFLPGLRIDGRGNTTTLNNERIAYQTLLSEWNAQSTSINITDDLYFALDEAESYTERTIRLLDTFISVFQDQDSGSRYTETELTGFISQFNAQRSALVGVESSLGAARAQLLAAEDGLERASLAASGSQNSAADAQVKQALGGLQAAQATLAKRVIRTPISGTVNSLDVQTGDFLSAQQEIAIVANNDALEIITSISEQERALFAVGDAVLIEGSIAGTVTAIAPAVSASTGKVEMRIAAESTTIQNGQTVTITPVETAAVETTVTLDQDVFVPIAAIKFSQSSAVMFTVTDNILVELPVTTGVIRGGTVEILSGLSVSDLFVADARGLQAGEVVEISQ